MKPHLYKKDMIHVLGITYCIEAVIVTIYKHFSVYYATNVYSQITQGHSRFLY